MSLSIHNTLKSRLAFAAGVSLAALSISAPAYAQDEEEATGNAAIVVTAQFREQALQDTPLSITAVDAALLESRNQTDLSQIASQAPNVTLNAMGGAYGSSLGASIRGIGQFDFNPAYEPGVGMYIDDVYYATLTGGIFDLLDLERVEVLRGPQGTLTGRNSIGGAIKMFSIKPDSGEEGMVSATYGSRNRVDLRASANFELGQDLYARVSGVFKRQDGYVDQIDYGCANPGNPEGISGLPSSGSDCVIDKLGEKNYSGVRAAIRYNPTDNFDLTVTGDYTYENRTNSAEVVTLVNPAKSSANYICGEFCTYANFYATGGGAGNQTTNAYYMPNSTKFEGWGVSANMTIGINDSLNLQSISAYREYNTIWGTDDDFTPGLTGGAQGYNDLSFWFASEELRLNGEIGDNIEFTVGGYYSDQRSTYFTRQDIRYIAPGLYFQFLGNDPVNADSKAAFGTVIYRPTDAMTVTAGVRYTEEHKDYTFVRKNWDGTPSIYLGALDGLTAIYDGSKFDWRISVDYRFSDAILAYATVATGFKGGGVTARPFDAAQALNGSFDPETVTAYELGLKTDVLDNRVRLNLAGFYNDYKDIQLPLSDCSALGSLAPCGARQNAGNGKIYGVEAELTAEPVDGLNIDGSVSYMSGEWSDISAAVGSSILLTDPIVTPEWKWSAGVQYTVELGNGGTVTPRFDIAYVGERSAGRQALISSDLLYNDAYTLANARLTWKNADEDLSISLEVQNLFDEYYLPAQFSAVYAFSGTVYSQVGRPREWAITATKRF